MSGIKAHLHTHMSLMGLPVAPSDCLSSSNRRTTPGGEQALSDVLTSTSKFAAMCAFTLGSTSQANLTRAISNSCDSMAAKVHMLEVDPQLLQS